MKTKLKTIRIILALFLIAGLALVSNAEAHTSRERELCGVLQSFDLKSGLLTFPSSKKNALASFAINHDTRFIKDWKFVNANSLKTGQRVCVFYHLPFIGKPFVTKVICINQN